MLQKEEFMRNVDLILAQSEEAGWTRAETMEHIRYPSNSLYRIYIPSNIYGTGFLRRHY